MTQSPKILSNDTEIGYRQWLKQTGLTKENGYDIDNDYSGIDNNARAFYNMNGPVQMSHVQLSRYLQYYPWVNMEQQQLLQQGGQTKPKAQTQAEIPHDPDVTGPISFLKSYLQSPEFQRKNTNNQFNPQQIQQMLDNLSKVKGYTLPDNYDKKVGEVLGSRAWDPHFTETVNKGLPPDKQLQIPSETNVVLDPVQAKRDLYPGMKPDLIRKHLDNDIFSHEAGHMMGRDLSLSDDIDFAFYNQDKRVQKLFDSPQYHKYIENARQEEVKRTIAGDKVVGRDKGFSNFLKSQYDTPGQQLPNNALHDASPEENYADLSAFRYLMYRQGIYDARKGQLTPEQMEKAMKDPYLKQSFPFKRLIKTFGKENLIQLNNKIASIDQQPSDQAKQGGSIKVSTEGYKASSPDKDAPELMIPSSHITMKGVNHPVIGMDEYGVTYFMIPGKDYHFPGNQVHEVPVRQMGGMLLRDREYQDGGQPDSAAMIKKYGPYVKDRTGWISWANQKTGDSTWKDAAINAASPYKLDPAFLYSSAMEEGLQQRIHNQGNVSESYYKNVDAKTAKDYPVDGFHDYGLDRFGEQFQTLVKKGYLKPEFQQQFHPFEGLNEQDQKVGTAAFRNDAAALQAKAAMMAYSRDRLSGYAQKKQINLSPEAQNFFTLAAYNLSDTGVQKMLDYFQKQGLLKDNAFLKTAPKLYAEVYKHVMPRMQGTNMLHGEHVFQQGGDTPSYYGKPDISLMMKNLQAVRTRNSYGNPASKSQQASDAAQPWMQSGQFLNKLFDHYDQTYNAIYNQGMEEKWPKAKLQKMLDQMTSPIQQQIDSVQSTMPQHYGEGGGIHIKASHRGRFTAWAKKHGMSVSEAAHHVMSNKGNYSPSVVKMANFAKNFAQEGMQVTDLAADKTDQGSTQQSNSQGNSQGKSNNNQKPFNPFAPQHPFLPYLNIFNRVLGAIGENMAVNDQNGQMRHQTILQSQQDSYTPRGMDQYGNPNVYQAGGVFDEDRSYLAPLPQEQSFPGAPTPNVNPGRADVEQASMSFSRLPRVKTDVKTDDKADFAFNYYVKKGVDPKVAAAIVGNLAIESGFNPMAKGDGGKATGIAQWHPERWSGLKKWAGANSLNPYDVTTQLDYVLHEPGWADKALKMTASAGSASEAAYAFGKSFERPNDKFADWGRRMGIAQKIHTKYLPDQQQYKEGGEYEMSDAEIAALEKQGYKIERL